MRKEKSDIWKIWKVISSSAGEIKATKDEYREFIETYRAQKGHYCYKKIFEKKEKGVKVYEMRGGCSRGDVIEEIQIAIVFPRLKKAVLVKRPLPFHLTEAKMKKNKLEVKTIEVLESVFRGEGSGYDLPSDTSNDWGYLSEVRCLREWIMDMKSGKGITKSILYETEPEYTWME